MRISDWSSDVCSSDLLDPNLDLLDLGERLLAKTRRIAKTRVRKLHAQPWKHAQLDIAKREFAAGFLLNLVLDLAAIVVRIKQQRDRDQRGDDEQHKAEIGRAHV